MDRVRIPEKVRVKFIMESLMGDRWRNQRQIMAKYNKVIGEGQIIWEIQLGDHHRVDMQQRGI